MAAGAGEEAGVSEGREGQVGQLAGLEVRPGVHLVVEGEGYGHRGQDLLALAGHSLVGR